MPQRPTLGQTIKDGFGLSVGATVGNRVVGAILGPTPVSVVATPSPVAKTVDPAELWHRCLEQTNFDVEKCEVFKPK